MFQNWSKCVNKMIILKTITFLGPKVFNQIYSYVKISHYIFKLNNALCVCVRGEASPHKRNIIMVKHSFHVFVTFIFNNHNVQNHTTHLDVSNWTHVPLLKKVLYDNKMRLQNIFQHLFLHPLALGQHVILFHLMVHE